MPDFPEPTFRDFLKDMFFIVLFIVVVIFPLVFAAELFAFATGGL